MSEGANMSCVQDATYKCRNVCWADCGTVAVGEMLEAWKYERCFMKAELRLSWVLQLNTALASCSCVELPVTDSSGITAREWHDSQ